MHKSKFHFVLWLVQTIEESRQIAEAGVWRNREDGSRFLNDWEIESEESVNLPPNVQDYNNMTLDECEIVSGVTLVEPRDAFKDPFQKVNDNAETN